MKQTVDAIITLPVEAIFKAVYFYFMFHKRKVRFFLDHEAGLLLNVVI